MNVVGTLVGYIPIDFEGADGVPLNGAHLCFTFEDEFAVGGVSVDKVWVNFSQKRPECVPMNELKLNHKYELIYAKHGLGAKSKDTLVRIKEFIK